MKLKHLFFILVALFPLVGQAQTLYPTDSLGIRKMISEMSLQEKIAQIRHLHQSDYDSSGRVDMDKLKDHLRGNAYGAVEAFGYSAEGYSKAVSEISEYMREHTRHRIPPFAVMEGLHGVVQDGCTIFPQSIALAATFRPDLIYEMATFIAEEMKAIGANQVLAPVLDLAREPRWGRVEETYGEDPFLVSEMAVAYVKGIRSRGLIATPKHFVAHGSPRSGLNLATVDGGEFELMNTYLEPFMKVIRDADPLSIMNCYSSYDGDVITGSRKYMHDLLRDSLGFKGYVYSDWGSIGMLTSFHRTARNDAEAAYQAITAGIDLEASSRCYDHLEALVQSGILDERYIDDALDNVLYAKMAAGWLQQYSPAEEEIHSPKAVSLARKLADESIILLKNEGSILPLDLTKLSSLALIGPNASVLQVGDYSWSKEDTLGNTPLNAFRDRLPKHIKLRYAKGCDLTSTDTSGIAGAVEVAKSADVTLLVLGSQSASLARDYLHATSGEGFDLNDLVLTGAQQQLLEAVSKTGKPVVLILVTGRPFDLRYAHDHIPGIVLQFYGGERQGDALYDMLTGASYPSGKLPISIPRSTGHIPCYYNHYEADKGFYHQPGTPEAPGRDYVFSSPEALYSFGQGMSYTTFKISDVRQKGNYFQPTDTLRLTAQVSNTGKRPGSEVIQLYVRRPHSRHTRPVMSLKAFEKVYPAPGKSVSVNLSLPMHELSLHLPTSGWFVDPGTYEVMLGTSSRDIFWRSTFEIAYPAGVQDPFKQFNPQAPQHDEVDASGESTQLEVTLTVRDLQTSPVAHAEVLLNGKGIGKTNAQGAITFKALSGQSLELKREGYRTLTHTLKPQDKDLQITLTSGSDLLFLLQLFYQLLRVVGTDCLHQALALNEVFHLCICVSIVA